MTANRLSDLKMAERRAVRRWGRLSRGHRLMNPIHRLIHAEWSKFGGCGGLEPAQTVAILLREKERETRICNRRELKELAEINKLYAGAQ